MISSLTRDYGYSGGDNGIFGSSYIVSGMLGSLIAGILLDKLQKFKLTLIFAILIAIIALITTFYTLPTGNVLLLALTFGLCGVGILPVSTISYSFAVELTFPTPEHVSSGIIILPSKIYAGLLGLLAGYLSEEYGANYAIIAFLMNGIISLLGCLFIKEELRIL